MKKILLTTAFIYSLSLCTFGQVLDSASFDFWVGQWNAEWSLQNGETGKGTNFITKELDGKVIEENFSILEGPNAGFKGKSLSVYNPLNKIWHQAWTDNQGGYYDFHGAIEGDRNIFTTNVLEQGDKRIIQRMVFYDIEADSFTWDWEGTQDGGETWNLLWRINYTRQ